MQETEHGKMCCVGVVVNELINIITRGTAIVVGRTSRGLIAPFCKINLPRIRSCNTLSNGISHIQIDAAVSEIQLFDTSVNCVTQGSALKSL